MNALQTLPRLGSQQTASAAPNPDLAAIGNSPAGPTFERVLRTLVS